MPESKRTQFYNYLSSNNLIEGANSEQEFYNKLNNPQKRKDLFNYLSTNKLVEGNESQFDSLVLPPDNMLKKQNKIDDSTLAGYIQPQYRTLSIMDSGFFSDKLTKKNEESIYLKNHAKLPEIEVKGERYKQEPTVDKELGSKLVRNDVLKNALKMEDMTGDMLISFGNALSKFMLKDAPSSIVQTGIGLETAIRHIGSAYFGADDKYGKITETRTKELYRQADKLGSVLDIISPKNPKKEGDFLTDQLPSGFASMVGYMAINAALPGAGFLPVQSFSAGEQAYKETGDVNKANAVFAENLLGDASEKLPIEAMMNRVGKLSKLFIQGSEELKTPLNRKIAIFAKESLLLGGVPELGQEGIQQFLQNASIKDIYDAKKELTDGVLEGGLMGFITGATMGFITGGFHTDAKSDRKYKVAYQTQQLNKAQGKDIHGNVLPITGATQEDLEKANAIEELKQEAKKVTEKIEKKMEKLQPPLEVQVSQRVNNVILFGTDAVEPTAINENKDILYERLSKIEEPVVLDHVLQNGINNITRVEDMHNGHTSITTDGLKDQLNPENPEYKQITDVLLSNLAINDKESYDILSKPLDTRTDESTEQTQIDISKAKEVLSKPSIQPAIEEASKKLIELKEEKGINDNEIVLGDYAGDANSFFNEDIAVENVDLDMPVDYNYKSVDILQTPKAEQIFAKGEKNKWSLDKILTELAIPKQQKDILLKSGKVNRQELIKHLNDNYKYVVDIQTAKDKDTDVGIYDETPPEFSDIITEMEYESQYNFTFQPGTPEFGAEANRRYQERYGSEGQSITQPNSLYYSQLTVPGGTNYQENRIITPNIMPIIKGHPSFAENNDIGWFRSDDKATDIGEPESDGAGGIVRRSTATKTRRILEIQSDLFQKGRDNNFLAAAEKTSAEYYMEEHYDDGEDNIMPGYNEAYMQQTHEAYEKVEPQNQFLQLFNKDNNWVPFFIKSIVQNSIKEGYEKVWLPRGETAAKIEGHETLAKEIEKINEQIKIAEITINRKDELEGLQKELARLKQSLVDFERDVREVAVITDQEPDLGIEDSKKYGLEEFRYVRVESSYSRPQVFIPGTWEYPNYAENRAALGDNYEGYYIHAYNTGNRTPSSKFIKITKREAQAIYIKDPSLSREDESTRNMIVRDMHRVSEEIDAISNADSVLHSLEHRKEELKSQGLDKLKPIEGFYEVKVKNIIDKIYGKNNIATVVDEHGNGWYELDLATISNEILFHPEMQIAIEDKINTQIEKMNVEYDRKYTGEEIISMLPEGNKAGDKLLRDVLVKTNAKVVFVNKKLYNKDGQQISALYRKSGEDANTIFISSYFTDRIPVAQGLLHEGIHSITSMFLNKEHELYDAEFTSEITRIREEASKIDLSKVEDTDDRRLIEYALQNNDEFLAGIFSGTSDALVNALNQIEGKNSKGKSLWKQFVDLLLKQWNMIINDKSLLSELSDLLDAKLMSAKVSQLGTLPSINKVLQDATIDLGMAEVNKEYKVKPMSELKRDSDTPAVATYDPITDAIYYDDLAGEEEYQIDNLGYKNIKQYKSHVIAHETIHAKVKNNSTTFANMLGIDGEVLDKHKKEAILLIGYTKEYLAEYYAYRNNGYKQTEAINKAQKSAKYIRDIVDVDYKDANKIYSKLFPNKEDLQITLDYIAEYFDIQYSLQNTPTQLPISKQTPNYIAPIVPKPIQEIKQEVLDTQVPTTPELAEAVDNDVDNEIDEFNINDHFDVANIKYLTEFAVQFGETLKGESPVAKLQSFGTFTKWYGLKDKLMQLSNDDLTGRQAYLWSKFNDVWLNEYKPKGWTKEEYVNRVLMKIWVSNILKEEQEVINVDVRAGTNQWFMSHQKLKGEYRDSKGKKENTLRAPALIKNYEEQISALLNTPVTVAYLNAVDDANKGKDNYRDIRDTEIGFADFTMALWEEGYMFLNVFGDKSTMPILKINPKEMGIATNRLSNLWNVLADELGIKEAFTVELKTAQITRMLLEELRLGNTVENLQAGINAALGVNATGGNTDFKQYFKTYKSNLASLMKRGTMALENTIVEDAFLIDKYKDTKLIPDSTTQTVSGYIDGKLVEKTIPNPIYQKDGKIYYNTVFVDVEKFLDTWGDEVVEIKYKHNGENIKVRLRDVLLTFDGIGEAIPDGLDLITEDAANLYYDAVGSLKEGIIKSATVTKEGIYIKSSTQPISTKSDAIGKWMKNHGIARLVFSKSEKNTTGVYPLIDLAQLSNPMADSTKLGHPILLSDMHPIKETGIVKNETRGQAQWYNASGITSLNSAIEEVDPDNELASISQRTATRLAIWANKKLEDLSTAAAKKEMIETYQYKAYSGIQKAAADFLMGVMDNPNIDKMYTHPHLRALFDQMMHKQLLDALQMKSMGSRPIFVADLGWLRTSVPIAIKNACQWGILNENITSEDYKLIIPNGMGNTIKNLNDLRADYQKLEIKWKYKDEVSNKKRAELENQYIEAKRIFEEAYEEARKEFNEQYPDKKIGKNHEYKTSNFFLDRVALDNYINKKFNEKVDKSGKLKAGYCVVSRDVARANGLRVGDKVLTSITPTSDSMGMNSFEVAAIMDERSLSTNAVVLPAEYLQTVGKDYDIDDCALMGYDSDIWSKEDWDKMTDIIPRLYKATVNQFYELAKEHIDNIIPTKELVIGNSDVRKTIMKGIFGDSDISVDKGWSIIGSSAFSLGEQFKKDVAEPINLRWQHTLFNAIGLHSKIAGKEMMPDKNWDKVYMVLSHMTQDKVDFPKTTNWLEYGKRNGKDTSVRAIKKMMWGGMTGAKMQAIDIANDVIFGKLMALPKNKDGFFESRTSIETIEYIEYCKNILGSLESQKKQLIANANKRIKTDDAVMYQIISKYIKEYITNLKIDKPNNFALNNIIQNLDTDTALKTVDTTSRTHYRNTEFAVMKSLANEYPDIVEKTSKQAIPKELTTAKDSEKWIHRFVKALQHNREFAIFRQQLIEIMSPRLESDKGDNDSPQGRAKDNISPTLYKEMLKQKTFEFSGNKPVTIGNYTFSREGDKLKVNNMYSYELSESDIEAIGKLMAIRGNRYAIQQLLPIGRTNLTLDKRIQIAIEFLRNSKMDKRTSDLLFTSLLTPYRLIQYKDAKGNIVKQTYQPMTDAHKNLISSHPDISRGSKVITYNYNQHLYNLASIFNPEWLKRYVEQYIENEMLDSKSVENDKVKKLQNNTDTIQELGMPSYPTNSKNKYADDLLQRVATTDKSIDKVVTNKATMALELVKFLNTLNKNPEDALAMIRAKLDSELIRKEFSINNYHDYRELIDDVYNNNATVLNKMYGIKYVKDITKEVREFFSDDSIPKVDGTKSHGILLRFYWDLLRRETRVQSPIWSKITSNLMPSALFSQIYGNEVYNSKDKITGLNRVKLLNNSDSLEEENVRWTLNDKNIFNRGIGKVSINQVMQNRIDGFITSQINEIETVLDNLNRQVIDNANAYSAGNSTNAKRFNQTVAEIVEFKWKKLGITLEPTMNGVNVIYKGEVQKNLEQLATRIYNDPMAQQALISAINVRKMWDVEVPTIYRNMLLYLNEQYEYYEGLDTSLGNQNAKYIAQIRNRYTGILNAIESYKDKEYSYFYRKYPDRVIRDEFSVYWWDQIAREVALRNPRWSTKEVDRETDRLIKQKFRGMTQDSSQKVLNPNHLKRELGNNDKYDTSTFTPYLDYQNNLVRTIKQDLLFTEALMYKNKAIENGEESWVIKHMLKTYALESSNPLLHTKTINKEKIKNGTQVQFYWIDRRTGDEKSVFGEVKQTSNTTITLATRVKKTTIVDGKKSIYYDIQDVTFNISDIYGRDELHNIDRSKVQRYINKPVGIMEVIAAENDTNDADTITKYINMNSAKGLVESTGRALNWLISNTVMGGTRVISFMWHNLIGGKLTQYAYRPIKYGIERSFGKDSQERKKIESIKFGDTIDESNRKRYNVKRAMREAGIGGEDNAFNYALGSIMTDTELSVDETGLFGKTPLDKFREAKVLLKAVRDKYGYSEYARKRTELAEKMKTSDRKAKLIASKEFNDLEAEWSLKVANIPPIVNELFDLTNKQALLMLSKMLTKGTMDELSKIGQLPELSLRRESFFNGYFDALEVGMTHSEALEKAKQRITYDNAQYTDMHQSNLRNTIWGKIIEKFSHYTKNRATTYYKLTGEIFNQALIGKKENEINASLILTKMFIKDALVANLAGYTGGALMDPIFQTLWAIIKALLGIWDDKDEKGRFSPKTRDKDIRRNSYQIVPVTGFGGTIPKTALIEALGWIPQPTKYVGLYKMGNKEKYKVNTLNELWYGNPNKRKITGLKDILNSKKDNKGFEALKVILE